MTDWDMKLALELKHSHTFNICIFMQHNSMKSNMYIGAY